MQSSLVIIKLLYLIVLYSTQIEYKKKFPALGSLVKVRFANTGSLDRRESPKGFVSGGEHSMRPFINYVTHLGGGGKSQCYKM